MKGKNVVIHIYDYDSSLVGSRLLDELIKDLVAYSIPLDFPIEAIKCQSIIMRTNIIRKIRNYKDPLGGTTIKKGISLKNIPEWKPVENYEKIWGKDYEKNIEILDRAIEETEGQIIMFNDRPIDARYHRVCGGATENSENVDGNIILYLRKVLCSYCEDSPNYRNYKDISIKEIEEKLGIRFLELESTNKVEIQNMIYDITRDESGRIINLKIAGKEFEGNTVRNLLGLDSTKFCLQPQRIRFLTIGQGDGVGLCQWGSNKLAKEGKLAQDILKYYYTGVEIKKSSNYSINTPLLGKVLVIDPAHGGHQGDDHTSPNGLREKELNLEIALYLEKILEEMGATIYLTRREDQYVPVTERAKLTNEVKPDFFITLHQNYIKNTNVSGTEIYFYRGDEEAELLGLLVMEKMTEKLNTTNRGVRIADFFLLREVKVSGIHIEVGYISNQGDESQLMKPDFRRQVAEAISEALSSYFSINY